jgi:hypothetical protein
MKKLRSIQKFPFNRDLEELSQNIVMKPKANRLFYPALVVLILVLGLFSSCRNNRMKTDEKSLTKQILTEEEQLAQEAGLRDEREKQLADSLAKLPKGFRFEEKRDADPQRPPVVINIADNLENIAELKLSNVASDIQYIRLDPIPDPTGPRNLKYKYYMMDNYLVALNIYGIHLFTKEGKYLRSVVKNQLTDVEYIEKENRLRFWNDYTLVGGGTSVWARGNTLFYVYSNNITGQQVIMEYDCSKEQTLLNTGFNPENPSSINGLGEVSIDLKHGNTTPPPPRKHQGMWSAPPESMYEQLGIFSPDRNTYISNLHGEKMLGILGDQGDTLATFAKTERLENYTKSLMRGTDGGTQYERGGNLYFRSQFNDTVFQVVPPNQLFPVYVLNLGKYKTSMQEGVDPDASLEGRIIPYDWADSKDYIFLTFTKDSYDCPNTRKNKSVKIYHALFSKSSHQLQIVNTDPLDYAAPVLLNDTDGGYPVWPLSYQIGDKGEIMLSLKGSDLKSQVKSKQFIESVAPVDKKGKLKQMADSVNDEDDILMIVK